MSRLSTFLRNSGCVRSRPPNEFDECQSQQAFDRMQRHRVLQQHQRNILPFWSQVKEDIINGIKKDSQELNDLLSQMLDIGRQLIGLDSTNDLVESSAVYVLQVFHDSLYLKAISIVTQEVVNHLEEMFGSEEITNELVEKALIHSKTCLELLDIEDRERLFVPFNERHCFDSRSKSKHKNKTFLDISNTYESEEEWNNGLKDIDLDPFGGKFTTEWKSYLDNFCHKNQKQINGKENTGSEGQVDKKEWLINELSKYKENIFEDIISWEPIEDKTNEELTNDLHKLLDNSFNTFIENIIKNVWKFKSFSKIESTVCLSQLESTVCLSQLLRSMCDPLFKEESRQRRPHYPYIFDAFIETKRTPAFIAGAKTTLPLGYKRNDQRLWEEIKIPAPSPPPEDVINDYKLIDIEELDEFGKIGFKGIKQLNRIQSIVFNTAYTTSAHMLVCAPTGSGKTNVALLTILNEIRSHSPTNDVNDIDLNAFKVVYIAPMKALASEMTDNFSKRLEPFGVQVRELTGDMQLSRHEILSTQILVTTPEKWDVVTRKTKGDIHLLQLIRVVIIDEVHLLQNERGPVLEALVARIVRYMKSEKEWIRLVGLSATLPNYADVAQFLHVDPSNGLFVFDDRFRPVPLTQTFIGCKATQTTQLMHDMNDVCYERVYEMVANDHQVMVFVHARNATDRTANNLKDRAYKKSQISVFRRNTDQLSDWEQLIRKAKYRGLRILFESGFAVHHAGMLRQDRNLVERLFRAGIIKVLVSTATLAWGVNLPAHSVVIRGTEMYDSSHGNFIDITLLDVMQIFGRAGRPQYDTEGQGIIITAHNKMNHYLSLLTNQYPIESNFKNYLTDNMNAEIVSGTITTEEEAVEWICDTYLFIRMKKNPKYYSISQNDIKNDNNLYEIRRSLVRQSAEELDRAKMIRYSPDTRTMEPTHLGRTASHYYIKYKTIIKFNEFIKDSMSKKEIFAMISTAQEFHQLKCREDEFEELERLLRRNCYLGSLDGMENNKKVIILLQSYLSYSRIDNFSLLSDSLFIIQNVRRITRGLLEYSLKNGWALLAQNLLKLSQMFEQRMWDKDSPFRQFNEISWEVITRMEDKKLSVDKVRASSVDEIGAILNQPYYYASTIKRLANTLPKVEIKAKPESKTKTVVTFDLKIRPNFLWEDRFHGKFSQSLWIWLMDRKANHIYHSELFKLTKSQVCDKVLIKFSFNIKPLDPDSLPEQYIIHTSFDRWFGCDLDLTVPLNDHNN